MIKPLPNKILVKLKEYKNETKSGIILSTTTKEMQQVAKVIEVGKDVEDSGIKKGDTVLINKYAGTEAEYEGMEYIVLKIEDVIAIVE